MKYESTPLEVNLSPFTVIYRFECVYRNADAKFICLLCFEWYVSISLSLSLWLSTFRSASFSFPVGPCECVCVSKFDTWTENTVVKQKWQTTYQIIPQSDENNYNNNYTNQTSCWLDVNANDKVWFSGFGMFNIGLVDFTCNTKQ